MEYRFAQPSDWPAISQLLADHEYAVNAGQVGGAWLIAVRSDGSLAGVIWWFTDGLNAYVDFFLSTSPMVAGRLVALAEHVLRTIGVKHVRANTSSPAAQRLLSKIGMWTLPKTFLYKEL